MKNTQINYVFQRVEKKYLLDEINYKLLLKHIKPYMSCDRYGLSTVCNIYFDTDTYDIIRHSIEKPEYKEKLRLRSYGVPGDEDTVFLEIKKKLNGTVYKRRISLKLKEAKIYLEHGIKPSYDSRIFHEIDYFIRFYKPKAKLFLAYDRTAYSGNEFLRCA
jgi:hypothetical protein